MKTLCGFEPNEKGEYPIEAYVELCKRLGIPFPFQLNEENGCSKQVVTNDQALLGETEQPENETDKQQNGVANDVICDGLTVSDVRRLTDKDNPCHAPELFEALKAWAYVSTHPHDGFTVKQALENEIKEVYSGTRERERIVTVANWDKSGKKN